MALSGLLEQNKQGVWQIKLIKVTDGKRISSGESFNCEAQDVIDVTLGNLINESYESQRLYYWTNVRGSTMLLDTLKLASCLSNQLPKESQGKLLSLFDITAWRALLTIINTNVGSLLRNSIGNSEDIKTDSWISALQNLQMALLAPEIYGDKTDPRAVVENIQTSLRIILKNYGEISKHHCILTSIDNYIKLISKDTSIISHFENFDLFAKICSKSAQLLSIEKLIAYESRQKEYKNPGFFQSIPSKNLSSSFKHLNDKNVVSVLLLSHILGAFSVRECCMRYISLFLSAELRQVLFKTSDEYDVEFVESLSFVPKSLQQYMLLLLSTRSSENDI